MNGMATECVRKKLVDVGWHAATMILLLVGIVWVAIEHVETADSAVKNPFGSFGSNTRRQMDESGVDDDIPDGLSVDVTFEDILKTVIFLMTSWIMAVLSQLIGLPSLVGEIVTGFVLGPPLLDFVAYPEAMVLIGSFGLISLLLDSGINLDIAQLRETGSRAVLMAVTGTILALALGIGMGHAADSSDFRRSFAIGAAFAPSSFGVASQVLSKGEVLNTPMGQVIVAASVVDDILGLILLSIMEVLVKDDPKVIEYIIPFLSSFGYLLVFGYIGITQVPWIVEQKILPRFPEQSRDFVGFSLLFITLALFLPLLNYSGASYLTGAFLAGLSFSQINSVHARYVGSGPHLKIWLMRIFFAATIGFQVPIRYFSKDNVLNWGFLYFFPVLAKLPLGLLVPRMSSDLPDGFPYDPYRRDVIITTLAMLCRGEFNFIVASFALSAGVLHPEHYAAVVFAILLSAIIFPLALSKTIRYYNNKFQAFLEAGHKIDRIGDTNDGTRPLFLAIQARTPVTWGIQEKFKQALESTGLSVIDHRSWHTLGLDAVDITEIFCQDKVARLRVRHVFKKASPPSSRNSTSEDDIFEAKVISTIKESPSTEDLTMLEDEEEEEEDRNELLEIELRKQIIRDALVECLGSDVDETKYAIQVSQWDTFVFGDTAKNQGEGDAEEGVDLSRRAGYRFVTPASPASAPIEDGGSGNEQPTETEAQTQETTLRFRPLARLRSVSGGTHSDIGSAMAEDPKLDLDLWDTDQVTHDSVSEGYYMSPFDDIGTQTLTEGCPGEIQGDRGRRRGQHHRRNISDGGGAVFDAASSPSQDIGHHHRRNTSEGAPLFDGESAGGRQTRGHRRRSTTSDVRFGFDAALLNEYNREVEASTIKDRLHGYIRP